MTTSLALLCAKVVGFWAVAILFGGAGFLLALRRSSAAAIAVLRSASLMAAASGVIWFLGVFTSVTEDVGSLTSGEAWSAFLSAPFAIPWLFRLGLCALAIVVSLARTPKYFLVVGALFAVDQAWLGHAADNHGAPLTSIGFYVMHVLGGFAWVGSLTMLCVIVRKDRPLLREGLALFSGLGIGLVALIAATGLVNASLRGVDIRHLGATAYGRLLATKLALFAAMLTCALYNRSRRRAAGSGRTGVAPLAIETLFGLIVIALAAALGSTAPPT